MSDKVCCATCARPIWDGGHALRDDECSEREGYDCRLTAEASRLTRTVEEQRATIERLGNDVNAGRLAYLAVVDAVAAETGGPEDAATKARATRADLAETRACLATAREELVKAWQEKDAAVREADRLRHGAPVEGDFVCPDSLRADEARRELAEARRVIAAVRAAREEYDEDDSAPATLIDALDEALLSAPSHQTSGTGEGLHKCARAACIAVGLHPHRDLSGLYCTPCGRRINEANGVTLVDLDAPCALVDAGQP